MSKNVINMPKTRRQISITKKENKSSDNIRSKKSTRLKPCHNDISPLDNSNQSEPNSNSRSSKANLKIDSRVKKQIIQRKQEKDKIE